MLEDYRGGGLDWACSLGGGSIVACGFGWGVASVWVPKSSFKCIGGRSLL